MPREGAAAFEGRRSPASEQVWQHLHTHFVQAPRPNRGTNSKTQSTGKGPEGGIGGGERGTKVLSLLACRHLQLYAISAFFFSREVAEQASAPDKNAHFTFRYGVVPGNFAGQIGVQSRVQSVPQWRQKIYG